MRKKGWKGGIKAVEKVEDANHMVVHLVSWQGGIYFWLWTNNVKITVETWSWLSGHSSPVYSLCQWWQDKHLSALVSGN